jgi:hypothetical protein
MGTLSSGARAQGVRMRWMMVWAGLSGCYTEANWDTHQAGVVCRRQATCDRATFEANFDDVGECRDAVLDVSEPLTACFVEAGCEFDPSEAAACDAAMRQASCEEFEDGSYGSECDAIYDCDDAGAIELGLCLLDAAL